MKNRLFFILSIALFFVSCKDNNTKRLAENKKEVARKEVLFKKINESWVFYDTPINEASESIVGTWNELRVFMDELAQKPKKSIGAFQQKAKAIANAAKQLDKNIPIQFDKPQIKGRIATVITKASMLNLYINLDRIPEKKVIQMISETNRELAALQREMDKIVEKSKIPEEEGEADLKRMLDSSRAIPSIPAETNTPRVE